MKSLWWLVLLLTACASAGTSFSWDQARTVQVGMTKEDVVKTMGSPNRVAAMADGTERWVWVNVNYNMVNMETRSFNISLRDGRVTQVPNIPAEFK